MNPDMRIRVMVLSAAIGLTAAHADPLSSADREALLGKLEELRNAADSKVDSRFRVALAAYRSAMSSEGTAIEFYLKCVEKVDFEDRQRKSADFRDWKRKQSDRLSEPGFKLALRYQLQWLTLTLQAASSKADRPALAAEAQVVVDSIFRDAVKLEGQGGVLSQSVTSTVFARAYDIGNVEITDWTESPVQLDRVYNQIVFPRVRKAGQTESLRAAWIKRIQQEGIKIEAWGGGGRGRKGGGSQEYETFVSETLPDLQWRMEMDLFRSGDEGGAAMRMLAHIEKYITHKEARAWGEEFKNLLKPAPAPETTAAAVEP